VYRLLELEYADEVVPATVYAVYKDGRMKPIWSGVIRPDRLGKAVSSSPVGSAGGSTGSSGHADDSGSVILAGTSDSSVTVIAGADYVSTGPQSPALAERAAKNCATPNSIVAHFKKEFEAQWARTTQSGEENGSLIFYEQATNTYPKVTLSEGRHMTDRITSVPAMPEIGPETRKAFEDFAKANQKVYLLAVFHTHPDYPYSMGSRSGNPSNYDIQYQSDHQNALGIIRTSKGYSFFSNGKTFWPNDPRANECIWTLNHQRN